MSEKTIHIRKADDSETTWCGRSTQWGEKIRWGSPYEGNCAACREAFSDALVESIRNA